VNFPVQVMADLLRLETVEPIVQVEQMEEEELVQVGAAAALVERGGVPSTMM
jgi:hypothetical protein